ncbi:MAG TPA: hypothetical protein VFH37_01930 [Candidatus Saccharimonadales bacterium]|nr:hypothetical protein [Candidatus Saccharimonadales bacterium]
MKEAPLFNPDTDESDIKFRKLLKARGFEGPAADSIIDRTRGNDEARQRWYDVYGHLLETDEGTEESPAETAG